MSIVWKNEKRKLKELLPWNRNPRQIKKEQAERLVDSFDNFGQVEILAIGPNNDIYNGHQRLSVLLDEFGEEYEVDVRVSSRELTEKEREKLTIYLHKGTTGEWNFDELANSFDFDELLEWGFKEYELGMNIKNIDLQSMDDMIEKELWPVIKIRVSPEIKEKFDMIMKITPGKDDGEKFSTIIYRLVKV